MEKTLHELINKNNISGSQVDYSMIEATRFLDYRG